MSLVACEAQQYEKIKTEIFPDSLEAIRCLAQEIAQLIRKKTQEGKPTVLGLATGSTPVLLYRELRRLHQEEELSFHKVITFNLDEYYPMEREHPESYFRFMKEQLFNHVDLLEEHCHVPHGSSPRHNVFEECQAYEKKIRDVGGIDLQILGIGRTGHIGFNEPGSSRESRTRLVTLDRLTRRDAARDFLGEENVPRFAVTMGVGSILEARQVVLLAWGSSKAQIIAEAIEGPEIDTLPASFLQQHPQARCLLDEAAAGKLTRRARPWLVGAVEWPPQQIRHAVCWLSTQVKKPVLKLVDEEYSEHGMADLITSHGSAYHLNLRIFNEVQHTITGWPGGKPEKESSPRPERSQPYPKRILVLSPEPWDAIFCMGGTIHRLQQQGHEVKMVAMTSGHLAMPDEETLKYVYLWEMGADRLEGVGKALKNRVHEWKEALEKKGRWGEAPTALRQFKSLICRSEALMAARKCGLEAHHVDFLDLPFYQEGKYRQFTLGPQDREACQSLLEQFQPHQIFTTGLLADPSTIASLCFRLWREAWRTLDHETSWVKDCWVWLYRGLDWEWEAHEIDMAVPLSPDELQLKMSAMDQCQSQRSQTPWATSRNRQVWTQAQKSNHANAKLYDNLGFAEYEAIEAFQKG